MDEQRATKPFRGRWRLLALVVATLVLLMVGLGVWWWNDDRDLAQVRAFATANRVPASWEDYGLKPVDGDRLALWERIVALEKRLPAYGSKMASNSPAAFTSFAPIPAEMRTHHAALDAAALDELMAALDELGDGRLVLHARIEFRTSMPEIGVYRNLLRLLRERAALADAPEAARLCRRQLALCRGYSADTLLAHLVRVSLIDIALQAITDRLADIGSADPALAETILATVEPLPGGLSRSLTGEFLCCYSLCAQRDPAPGTSPWYFPLLTKAGRGELLQNSITAILETRAGALSPALAWAEAHDRRLQAARGIIPTPGVILSGMMAPAYERIITTTHESVLRGRLIAAELRGQPWPVDTFDPGGRTLRPFRRDERIIGAYTVGRDGIDHGGVKTKDRYFPLYGPLSPPVITP
jgi:hypothetical protein